MSLPNNANVALRSEPRPAVDVSIILPTYNERANICDLMEAIGQVFAIFVITVAAAEVGIGLAIVLMIFRNRKSANVDDLSLMRW